MAMAQAGFLNKINNILGLSLNQPDVLSNDEYYTISTIINWKYNETYEWCTTKYKVTTTKGRTFYGDRKTKCLKAL